MRIAIRILAILSILASALALGLSYGSGGLSDTDPRFGDSIMATLAGFALALATFLVTLIAAASRRQIAWLIALLAVVVLVVAAAFGGGELLSSFVPSPQALPDCQNQPISPQCPPSGTQEFLLNLPGLIGGAAPLVIGLVALLYSFRVRDARLMASATT